MALRRLLQRSSINQISSRVLPCCSQYFSTTASPSEPIQATLFPTLFHKCCHKVAEKYPEVTYEEVIIDNCCMMLVKNPTLFNVLVMPNLYGDIISDLCAGLISGLGLTPSRDIGEGGIALVEAVYGLAPDITSKNLANPTTLLLSSVMMLCHLKLNDKADQVHNAILSTIAKGKHRTVDLGGNSSIIDFTKAVCGHL